MIVDKKNNKIYKADAEEEKEILNLQKEALQYLNYNNMYELMKNKKDFKEFNNIINKEIGYNYYFAYDITIGDRALKIEYDNVLKSNMNKLIIDKTNKMFNKDRYTYYKNDYETLINLLINEDNNDTEFFNNLYAKRNENLRKYDAEMTDLIIKYDIEEKEIKNKYLDIYKN